MAGHVLPSDDVQIVGTAFECPTAISVSFAAVIRLTRDVASSSSSGEACDVASNEVSQARPSCDAAKSGAVAVKMSQPSSSPSVPAHPPATKPPCQSVTSFSAPGSNCAVSRGHADTSVVLKAAAFMTSDIQPNSPTLVIAFLSPATRRGQNPSSPPQYEWLAYCHVVPSAAWNARSSAPVPEPSPQYPRATHPGSRHATTIKSASSEGVW